MSINWKEAGFITLAGGLGGALSLVYSITVGNSLKIGLPEGIFAYIFLGMGAGFLGVYLIAKTDTSQLSHALGFAIACGLSWAPIMDATTALIKQNTERQLIQEIDAISEKVNTEIERAKKGSGDELSAISERIVEYSEQLAKIVNSASELETINKVNNAFSSIGVVADSIGERDKKLASTAQRKINEVVSTVNAKSVANLDIPFFRLLDPFTGIVEFSSHFPEGWIRSESLTPFATYKMMVGELEKEDSDRKVIVIKKDVEG